MRQGTFSYEIRAACRQEDAVALLSDISRQGDLHPLIVEVRELPTAEGAVRSWEIKDRLAMGPLKFGITYTADTLSITDDEIVTVAHQRPRTTLRNRVRFTTEPDGRVLISTVITLEAPTLLHGFALKTGRAAHLELAERIRTVLEAG